jgi:hypothetical protein
MDWRILVFHPEPENSKHILASIIYFDSDMAKSTNTVVYFDWKTVIYIYACGKKSHTIYVTRIILRPLSALFVLQFMLPMEKSVTFTGACANDFIPNE